MSSGFFLLVFFLSLWLIKARQWAPPRAYIAAVALGISVSLTIELLQVYLPSRDSSQADLICNTLGTFMGVILFHLL